LAVESQRAIAAASGGQLAGGDSSPTGGARVEDQSRALLLNTTLLSPSWTRGQERNADRLGTDLLVRAGYSPQGMVSLLQKQKSFETERAANPQAASLDQQLLGFDATERTQQRIAEAAPTLGAANEVLGTLAGAALGRTKDWATKQLDQGARAHPKTGERIADVQAYVAKEYGDVGAREPQVERWEAAKEADGTVDVLENYIAAIESMGKLASGDLAAARSLAKVGLSGPTRAHAYPNYADAAVQVAGGNPAQARADYEMALAGPGPAGAIYTSLSALYMAAGERDRAVEVMEGGYERLQEPPSLAVPLIETYRRTGRQSEADRLAAQCAMRWPALQSLCRGQAEGRSPDVP
jgi:predicted Zn-dependent protease